MGSAQAGLESKERESDEDPDKRPDSEPDRSEGIRSDLERYPKEDILVNMFWCA